MKINNLTIIDTEKALTGLVSMLVKNRKEVALDFECEFNLHRYGMHLCLIQLFDGESFYLIDPVKLHNLQPLKRLFHSRVLKIMFAAHGDLCLLNHLYRLQMKNVFDIQLAAKILEYDVLSLGGITEKVLGIKTSKSKSKQTANWNRRPLSPALIEYAVDDVRYLIQLKELFWDWICSRNKQKELLKKNRQLENARFRPVLYPHLKIKNASKLNPAQKKSLLRFYEVRDEIARKLDMAPHSLLSNETLIAICRHIPENRSAWLSLSGLHNKAIPYIDEFIRAAGN